MGTRADFYIGRGKDAMWLGSVAWDGYPDGVLVGIKLADDQKSFLDALETYFNGRNDVSTPNDGWPWPWDTSSGTDFAYAFDAGKVWMSHFGSAWITASSPEPEEWSENKEAVFPNMKDKANVTLGPRSGLLVGFIPRTS